MDVEGNSAHKRTQLKKQMVWIQVLEVEKELAALEKEASKRQQKLPSVSDKLERAQQLLETTNQRILQIEKNINESATEEGKQLNEEKARLLGEFKRRKDELNAIINEETQMNEAVRTLRSEAATFEGRIREERRKMHDRTSGFNDERLARIAEIDSQLAGLELERVEKDALLYSIEQEKNAVRPNIKDLESQQDSAARELRGLEQSLRQCEGAKRDKARLFGESVPAILKDIEDLHRAGKWRGGRPIGPVGKLRKERAALPVYVVPAWTVLYLSLYFLFRRTFAHQRSSLV
jgi:chromosome segregation ATPase